MADISDNAWSWSTTANSNNPSGSTNIGTNLDDNLRSLQAGVKTLVTPLSSVSGTNTITASAAVAPTAYAAGQRFKFIPANANTGAATINLNSLGAKSVFCGGAACVGGELQANIPVDIEYDGTQFNIVGPFSGGKIPGNVGIGVAPDTFTTYTTVLEGTGYALASNTVTTSVLGTNWYYNSSDKFRGSGYAMTYLQGAGQHSWYVSSASGTAGNAATLNLIMTTLTGGDFVIGGSASLGSNAAGQTSIISALNSANDGPLFLRNSNNTGGKFWKTGPTNNNGFVVFNQSNAGVYVTDGNTSWTATSSRTLKDEIETFPVLDKLDEFRAVSYVRKSTGRRELGVIAEEQAMFPELVDKNSEHWGVQYDRYGVLALMAVKELKAQTDALRLENEQLKARVLALESA